MKAGYTLSGRAATNNGVSSGEAVHAMGSQPWRSLCGRACQEIPEVEFDPKSAQSCVQCVRRAESAEKRMVANAKA